VDLEKSEFLAPPFPKVDLEKSEFLAPPFPKVEKVENVELKG
jgi:hypothetical protein